MRSTIEVDGGGLRDPLRQQVLRDPRRQREYLGVGVSPKAELGGRTAGGGS
jgi:hypothetical protein